MRIGRHMPTRSKMVQAARIAREIGCQTIQIFASNPTGWRTPGDDPEGCAAFAEATRVSDLDPVVLHAPYLINLGTPDEVIWEKSIALLTWTMQRGGLLGARFVVLHTGSHRGSGVEAGIARVAQGVERVWRESPAAVSLLLENDVGAGNSLGHSFEQLNAILALLPGYADRLGVCLDTAHLWGAGHDISTRETTLRVLEECEATFGLTRVKVVHLNDTEKALGSHRDVHARLGEGVLGDEGLRTMLGDPRLQHAAVIMETPIKADENDKEDWEHDKTQIARAKGLV